MTADKPDMSMLLSKMAKLLRQNAHDPAVILEYVTAFVRGLYYIVYFRVFRRNVKIGFPFSAFAPVKIVGPGSVVIGKYCCASLNVFKGLTIVTHYPDSLIRIGEGCVLGGVTIRCGKYIEIGDRTMSAPSLIQDSFLVDQAKDAALVAMGLMPPSKPVIIKDNVWVGADSIIISGSRIGKDSILAAGAGCYDFQADEYCLVIGNPAQKPLPIERLLKLKGHV